MGRRGISSFGDVLRNTADGRNLNDLYAELGEAAAVLNEQQENFLSLFTYSVTSPVASVLQTVGGGADVFEPASEYGVPQGSRIKHDTLDMGATFQWYDAAWRASWRYLASATSIEIQANADVILAAARESVFADVMRTVFNSANRQITDPKTDALHTVYAFANGDGWVPPSFGGNTFPGSHSHFRTSGAATVVSGDLDEIVDDLKSHGYSAENDTQIVIFCNAAEGNEISTFRVADGDRADFVPAAGARFYASGQLVGEQPAATFAGFAVKGGYDEAIIIETSRIPAGYVVGLASGGRLANSNPIMLREHETVRGLQLIPGPRDYPLIDSYWAHGFGTGVRHRLAGMVMQITASGSYTAPSVYAA